MTKSGKIISCSRWGNFFEKVANRQKYCLPCRAEVIKACKREVEERKRRAAGIEGIGSFKPCQICGSTFALKNGQQRYCEPCSDTRKKEVKTQINIRYRERHGDKLRAGEREWREKNPQAAKKRQEDYKERNAEARQASYKRYYRSKRNDPTFALNYRMRHSIWLSLKQQKRGQSWEELIGYTVDDLRRHLERQFVSGMSWENMGAWHIDHIVPLAIHEFESSEDPEFKAAWALTNLRPLWAEENLRKNAKRLMLL